MSPRELQACWHRAARCRNLYNEWGLNYVVIQQRSDCSVCYKDISGFLAQKTGSTASFNSAQLAVFYRESKHMTTARRGQGAGGQYTELCSGKEWVRSGESSEAKGG